MGSVQPKEVNSNLEDKKTCNECQELVQMNTENVAIITKDSHPISLAYAIHAVGLTMSSRRLPCT